MRPNAFLITHGCNFLEFIAKEAKTRNVIIYIMGQRLNTCKLYCQVHPSRTMKLNLKFATTIWALTEDCLL